MAEKGYLPYSGQYKVGQLEILCKVHVLQNYMQQHSNIYVQIGLDDEAKNVTICMFSALITP